jgi:hypothetical protein
MLAALYQEQIDEELVKPVGLMKIAEDYGIDWKPGWLLEFQKDLIGAGLLRGATNAFKDEMANGILTGQGLTYIEDKYGSKDGVGVLAVKMSDEAQLLPILDNRYADTATESASSSHEFIFDASKIQIAIDSTDWTGLSKKISASDLGEIRIRVTALKQSIIQSGTDEQTKLNAIARADAIANLLEAPDVPWREVVQILNSPALSAFLVVVNIIQFIIGLAN